MQSSYGATGRLSVYRDIVRMIGSAEVVVDPGDAEYEADMLISLRAGFMRYYWHRSLDGERLFAFPHTAYREHLAASHMAWMGPRRSPECHTAALHRPVIGGSSFVSTLELVSVWRGLSYAREVLSPAVGAEEPVLYRAIRS